MNEQRHLQCEQADECRAPVTHIGEKGWIYCGEHAVDRRTYGYERTRKLRKWELDLLRAGKPVPSYAPIPRHRYRADEAARALAEGLDEQAKSLNG